MKTAVIYARYSSDSQTEQSIEGQLRVCKSYAEHNDIVIIDTYIDRAMTGTNAKRPGFRKMIDDSGKKQFEIVLVYKLDRFSRNKFESAFFKKTLKDNGVKVVSATEHIPDGPEAIIYEGLLESVAEFYSAELSQKIKRGNNESRLKGNLTGGPIPSGYKNVNKKATIVEEQANVVRYIYIQYANGVFVKDIIRNLTAMGISYKGKPFAENTIYKILKNERYSGVYHFDGTTFDNIFPQIVDSYVFAKVQEKVNKNRFGKRSFKMSYLLKDKVKCGYCGQSIIGESGTAKSGQKKYYYKCRGRKARITDCDNPALRKEVLENLVIQALQKKLSDPKTIDEMVKGIMDAQKRAQANNPILTSLEREKRSVDCSIENVMKAIEQGVITQTTTSRLRELEEKRDTLSRQIIIEQSKKLKMLTEEEVRAYYMRYIKQSPPILIEHLIQKIVLYKDKIEIYYNNPLKNRPEETQDGSFCIGETTVSIKQKVTNSAITVRYAVRFLV